MHITSWNCKGLGNPTKAKAVKDLLKMVSTDILLLQQTKIKEDPLLILSKSRWKLNTGKAVSARGTSGGRNTLWCDENFQLKRWFVTQHWIFTDLFHISSKISLEIFNLWVPINYSDKNDCWKMLSEFIALNSPSNIVIAGD